MTAKLLKTSPYHDTGYGMLWMGNLLYGYPHITPTRTEIVKEVLSSKKFVDKNFAYVSLRSVFGNGLITR